MADQSGYYSDDAATFGDRLAGARDVAGLSHAALAGQLGVKTATLVAWENDLKEPRANRLQMLSGLLGVSLSWLLNGEGDGLSAPEDAPAMPNDVADILSELRATRVQIGASADRLATLEKRLRLSLQETP